MADDLSEREFHGRPFAIHSRDRDGGGSTASVTPRQFAAEGGAVEAEELGCGGAVAAGAGERFVDERRFRRLQKILVEPALARLCAAELRGHPIADRPLEAGFGGGSPVSGRVRGVLRSCCFRGAGERRREMLGAQRAATGDDCRDVDCGLQFADVPRPGAGPDRLEKVVRGRLERAAARAAGEKMRDERRDIVEPR